VLKGRATAGWQGRWAKLFYLLSAVAAFWAESQGRKATEQRWLENYG